MRLTDKFRFGKFKDSTLEEVMETEAGRDYLRWLSTRTLDVTNKYHDRNLKDQNDIKRELKKYEGPKPPVNPDPKGTISLMQKVIQLEGKIDKLINILEHIHGVSMSQEITDEGFDTTPPELQ